MVMLSKLPLCASILAILPALTSASNATLPFDYSALSLRTIGAPNTLVRAVSNHSRENK